MPTLYSHPMSTYAQRVHIALLEKGVTWDVKIVDMGKKEHRSPEYLAINPYGRVPALVDGALTLVESSAILDFLEAKHPSPPLQPASPEGRAELHMHIKLCDLQLAGHVGTIIFPKRFIPEARWQREVMANASKQVQKHITILDTHLTHRTWLVNEQFSLADIAYAPFLQFLPINATGSDSSVSQSRPRRTRSRSSPKYPAKRPSNTPMLIATPIAIVPVSTASRAPDTMLAATSRP